MPKLSQFLTWVRQALLETALLGKAPLSAETMETGPKQGGFAAAGNEC